MLPKLETERLANAAEFGMLSVLKTQLLNLASPDMAQRLCTANSNQRWASARFSAACEKLEDNRHANRVPNLTSEVEEAERQLAAATAAVEQVMATIIDE